MVIRYRFPITGTVLARETLRGDDKDPLCIIPLRDLPDFPTYYDEQRKVDSPEPLRYECLDYNIDEGWAEVELEASEQLHQWLLRLLNENTRDALYAMVGASRLKKLIGRHIS